VRLKDALVAKGYDVNYAWGWRPQPRHWRRELPEMMRWLWRDHPVSVDPNDTTERSFRTEGRCASRGSAARGESGGATLKQRRPTCTGGGNRTVLAEAMLRL
jgi:hypothetical protein